MTSALSVAHGLEHELLWQKIHRWIQQLKICSKGWRAWGQFWVPWYQPCGWDAFGPCLGLVQDAQLWAVYCHCPISSTTAVKSVSGTKRLFPRGIPLAVGVFFLCFFPEYFFLSLGLHRWVELPCQLFPTPWEGHFRPKLMLLVFFLQSKVLQCISRTLKK